MYFSVIGGVLFKEAYHGRIVPPDMIQEILLLKAALKIVLDPSGFAAYEKMSIVVVTTGVKRPQDILRRWKMREYMVFKTEFLV
jgi:hypothetical protein